MRTVDTPLRSKVLWSVVGWLVVFVFFFPVIWMWLEGLKTEPQAASSPPTIFFVPTLMEFQEVLSGDFPPFFINSAIASIASQNSSSVSFVSDSVGSTISASGTISGK